MKSFTQSDTSDERWSQDLNPNSLLQRLCFQGARWELLKGSTDTAGKTAWDGSVHETKKRLIMAGGTRNKSSCTKKLGHKKASKNVGGRERGPDKSSGMQGRVKWKTRERGWQKGKKALGALQIALYRLPERLIKATA